MSVTVSTGQTPLSYKATINKIFSTEVEKGKSQQVWPMYLDEETAEDKWVDDVEKVSMGLFSETEEGASLPLDAFAEGYSVRYYMKKFAKRALVPEEFYEDNKYLEVWDVPRQLASSALLSQEYDGVGVLNGMLTATSGDGATGYASASHNLRTGATASNLSTGLTPSESAVEAILVTCDKMVGSNGFIVGIKGVRLVGPSNYRFTMKKLLQSTEAPDTANRAINALKGELEDKYVSVPWMASTTQWGVKTNVKDGGKWFWKRKLKVKVTNDENTDVRVHTASYRSNRGVSNWRGYAWVNV